MKNSNDSISFIALHKLKHETYNRSCSQVELKPTDFSLLDAHSLPIHGTAWRVCVCFLQCVCATSSLWDKNKPMFKSYSFCVYTLYTICYSTQFFWMVNPIQIHHKYVMDNPSTFFKLD